MSGRRDGGRGVEGGEDRRTNGGDVEAEAGGGDGTGEAIAETADAATDVATDTATEGAAIVDVLVTREPVELYKVLKFEGLAGSGGEAKGLVDAGLVDVNGARETRRRRKLVDGDLVAFAGTTLRIRRA